MKQFKTPYALLAIVLTFLGLLYFYGTIILSPNSYVITNNGDGIKCYYVFAYHIKHDTTYHQFSGMNYPFGQTFIYTDGQPAITNIVKGLCTIFPAIEGYSIGIFNLLVLLCPLLTVWLVYKLLQRCNLPGLYSSIFAVLITFLSPQFFRLSGHLTLTYTCFFPLLWYWLIRYFDEGFNKLLYTLCLAGSTIFWGLVHPYYLPAQTFFLLGVYILHYIFYHQGWKINHRRFAYATTQIVLPVIAIKLYTVWVDKHTGRTENPNGFFDYVANWKTIFLPAFQKYHNTIVDLFGEKNTSWEGTAYIGLVADIALIIGIIFSIKYLIKRNYKNALGATLPFPIKIAFWPSVLLLLLAMAFPFSFNSFFAGMADKIPYLKQFRSLGRFAWAFYYVATVFAAWSFYQYFLYFKSKSKVYVGYAIGCIAIVFFGAECYLYQTNLLKWTELGVNTFNTQAYEAKYGISANFKWQDKYQAAIPIPFYRIGSESFGIAGSDEAMRYSFAFSYQTGLPLLSSSAARTPEWESTYALQFLSPKFDKKLIQPYLPSTKDFLVLYTDEPTPIFAEEEWLKQATPVQKNGQYSLLSYPSAINAYKEAKAVISNFENKRDNLIQHKGFFFDKPDTAGFYYFNYDKVKSPHSFEGAGAYNNNQTYRELIKDQYLGLDTAKEYVLSVWHYNMGEESNGFLLLLIETDSAGEYGDWKRYINFREVTTLYNGWSLYQYSFRPQSAGYKTTLMIPAINKEGISTYEDEIMIRPKGVNVYKPITKNGHRFLNYNNYRIAIN